jgi:hypothetical protein
MSSTSQASSAMQFERAERLKEALVEFATKGELKEEFERQSKNFFEEATHDHEHENESVLDWFLFDWFDEDGEGAIVRYLDEQPDLDDTDREILLNWLESINSVFEIVATAKNSVQLKDLDGGDYYTVKTRLAKTPFKPGHFIIARLLPLGNNLIFSGLQFLMPDRESALAWLEMRQAFDTFDSPEAIEKAQREQVAAFCELFGCDELTVPSTKLNSTLQRFQRYLINERRDPETGMTPAERFRQELGQELSVPDLAPSPDPVTNSSEVTILCDDFDGIVLLPDFNRFKRVFETDKPEKQVPDWKDLVWTYIKDPDIPIVAFERVAEDFPVRVEKVLRSLIGDKAFSLEHLYAVLLHYKQPVDGLEDLKDDQDLWDLFNNNPPNNTQPRERRSKNRTRTKAASKKSKPKAAPKKKASKSASKARGSASKRAAISRRPAAKLTTRTKLQKTRSAPASKKRAVKRTAAKKR